MTENPTLDATHDDDLADEAIDRTSGGKACTLLPTHRAAPAVLGR
jgi:hypothetical protein